MLKKLLNKHSPLWSDGSNSYSAYLYPHSFMFIIERIKSSL